MSRVEFKSSNIVLSIIIITLWTIYILANSLLYEMPYFDSRLPVKNKMRILKEETIKLCRAKKNNIIEISSGKSEYIKYQILSLPGKTYIDMDGDKIRFINIKSDIFCHFKNENVVRVKYEGKKYKADLGKYKNNKYIQLLGMKVCVLAENNIKSIINAMEAFKGEK